jgi:hypothetical protein
VESVFGDGLSLYFDEHPDDLKNKRANLQEIPEVITI